MSLSDVRQKIAAACKGAGRKAGDVTLVAVTKNRTLDEIRALIDAGQRHFGENRVQDALDKWPALKKEFPDIQLHFIGSLQSNKAGDAVELFDVIETVDRASLADALKKEMVKQGRNLPCFLQVNTGEEPQKGGVAPREIPALLQHCLDAKLDVQGLMCIPPAEDIPDMHFALLHKYAEKLSIKGLSMGMSADFEIAIRYGATYVRVGSALFQL